MSIPWMSSAPIGDALRGSVEKTLRASAVRRMTVVEAMITAYLNELDFMAERFRLREVKR